MGAPTSAFDHVYFFFARDVVTSIFLSFTCGIILGGGYLLSTVLKGGQDEKGLFWVEFSGVFEVTRTKTVKKFGIKFCWKTQICCRHP